MYGKKFKDIIINKKKCNASKYQDVNITKIISKKSFSYFKIEIKKNTLLNICNTNFYCSIIEGSIKINNKIIEDSTAKIKSNLCIEAAKNTIIFIFFQRRVLTLNIKDIPRPLNSIRNNFKKNIISKKYWGNIKVLFKNTNGSAKIIFMNRNTQSSMEYHIIKKENYFINFGLLHLGVRFGRAKQKIIKLNKNSSFFMDIGIMHMRMAKLDTQIIEISTTDSDEDSNIVEDGNYYKFKTII